MLLNIVAVLPLLLAIAIFADKTHLSLKPMREALMRPNLDVKSSLLSNLNKFFASGEKLEELEMSPPKLNIDADSTVTPNLHIVSNSVVRNATLNGKKTVAKRKLINAMDKTPKIMPIAERKNAVVGQSNALKKSYGTSRRIEKRPAKDEEQEPVKVIQKKGKTIRLFGLEKSGYRYNKSRSSGGGRAGKL
jgi:hypothetical protein